jgi:hypothetical protein
MRVIILLLFTTHPLVMASNNKKIDENDATINRKKSMIYSLVAQPNLNP